jgi:hypothetical protein
MIDKIIEELKDIDWFSILFITAPPLLLILAGELKK